MGIQYVETAAGPLKLVFIKSGTSGGIMAGTFISMVCVAVLGLYIYLKSPRWSKRFSAEYTLPYFATRIHFVIWMCLLQSFVLALGQLSFAISCTDLEGMMGFI